MCGSFAAKKRRGLLGVAVAVVIAVIVLLLMLTDIIPWRSGSLADIYDCDSYEISSLYVYSRQDGDVLFSTEADDLDKIRDMFIDLDWHPIGSSRGSVSLSALRDTLQVYAIFENSDGDEKGILIYCTGGDTISVHAMNVPRYRRSDMNYQVNGGYNLDWLYESDR